MGIKISFESDARLFCKICGEALVVESSSNDFRTKAGQDFYVSPCERCQPNVAKVAEIISQIKML